MRFHLSSTLKHTKNAAENEGLRKGFKSGAFWRRSISNADESWKRRPWKRCRKTPVVSICVFGHFSVNDRWNESKHMCLRIWTGMGTGDRCKNASVVENHDCAAEALKVWSGLVSRRSWKDAKVHRPLSVGNVNLTFNHSHTYILQLLIKFACYLQVEEGFGSNQVPACSEFAPHFFERSTGQVRTLPCFYLDVSLKFKTIVVYWTQTSDPKKSCKYTYLDTNQFQSKKIFWEGLTLQF